MDQEQEYTGQYSVLAKSIFSCIPPLRILFLTALATLFGTVAFAADTTSPTAPSALTATATSGTQINLSWTKSTDSVGVTGYRIERCSGGSCSSFAQIGTTTTALTFNNTGLTNTTSYSYQVRATDAAGNLSAYSNIATTSTLDTTKPTAPSGLTAATASSSQINLSWTASTDNVGVTGYHVERCTGSACTTYTEIATSSGITFSNISLTSSTAYRYRVRANDVAGNLSSYSSVVTATTTDITPPTAPTTLTTTVISGTQINLSWSAATDDIKVTGYRIERCNGINCSSFAQIATTTTAVTYNNTGLTSTTSYSYQVRAVDAAGNLSPYSNIATASTLDTTKPTAPTGLTTAVTSGTQINLNWTASTDNIGVTGYHIERCTGSTCTIYTEIATASGTTFSNTGLTPSTAYRYRVRANDAAGNLSTYSGIVTATTQADTTPPSAPTGLTATAASGTQINLSWTASTDLGGVTGYKVERCSGASCATFAQISTPTTTSYSDTGLTASTTYRYQVRATDAANNLSVYSTIVSAATQFAGPITYTYSYDNLGRVTQAGGSDGSVITYTYDANGNVTTLNRQ